MLVREFQEDYFAVQYLFHDPFHPLFEGDFRLNAVGSTFG